MREQIYLRSASSDRDYRWYEYVGQQTRACADPEPWEAVRGLLAHEEPCLSILGDQEGRCACVLTGLSSPRTANSRYIFDSWIVAGPDGRLSDLQKGLVIQFLRGKVSGLSALSSCLEDAGREGVQVRPELLESEIQHLAALAESFPEKTERALPLGIFRDDPESRLRLAEGLAKRDGVKPREVLAVITSGVRPEALAPKVVWGLTDHGRAEWMPEVVEVGPGEIREEPEPWLPPAPVSDRPHCQPPSEEDRVVQSRTSALLRTALWIGTGAVFFVLLFLLWRLRRD